MAAVCPDAWLLNYTNPMAMLCWATYAGTPQQRVVGLCHSVQHTSRRLSDYVGVPLEEVTFLAAGVNHQAWILRFEREGEDLYPLLDEAIARDPELQRRVRVELYRRLGYFPTESSEHSAEYVPWLMRDDWGARVLPTRTGPAWRCRAWRTRAASTRFHIGELPLQLAALNRTYLNVCEHGAGAIGRRGERAKMISQC